MKAVISNRIYMDIEPHQFNDLDNALTYKIDSYRRDQPPQIIKNLRTKKSKLCGFEQKKSMFSFF